MTHAAVAELADALSSGGSTSGCVGSNPISRTSSISMTIKGEVIWTKPRSPRESEDG